MGSEFEPRRAKAGQEFGFTDREGNQRTVKADDEGVVRPSTVEEVRTLDAFDLPLARNAIEEEAEEAPKAAPKSAGPRSGK
jgi:hypothetical protein